jgi:hypothetical protein
MPAHTALRKVPPMPSAYGAAFRVLSTSGLASDAWWAIRWMDRSSTNLSSLAALHGSSPNCAGRRIPVCVGRITSLLIRVNRATCSTGSWSTRCWAWRAGWTLRPVTEQWGATRRRSDTPLARVRLSGLLPNSARRCVQGQGGTRNDLSEDRKSGDADAIRFKVGREQRRS